MDPKLLQLLQLTRAQPQYGLIHKGVTTNDLSNLAEHHYLVSMTAWVVADCASKAGANINYERLFKICLVHDLGELFGGDISMPYARLNPEAKKHASAFEAANAKFIAEYFKDAKQEYLEIASEAHDPQTLEGIIMKIADYVEVQQFNTYKGFPLSTDHDFMRNKIKEKIQLIQDANIEQALTNFIDAWLETLKNTEIFPYTD